MRRELHDHYRFGKKNPFLGESFLVFMAGGGSGGSGSNPDEDKLTEEKVREEIAKGPETKLPENVVDFMKIRKQTTMEFELTLPAEFEKKVIDMQTFEGSIVYLNKLIEYFNNPDLNIDDDNLGKIPWANAQEDLNKQMKNVKQVLNLSFTPKDFTAVPTKAELIAGLEEARDKLQVEYTATAQKVHELSVESYKQQYDKLTDAWENMTIERNGETINMVPAYQHYIDRKKARYTALKQKLDDNLQIDISVGQEKALMESFARYEDDLQSEYKQIQIDKRWLEDAKTPELLQEEFNRLKNLFAEVATEANIDKYIEARQAEIQKLEEERPQIEQNLTQAEADFVQEMTQYQTMQAMGGVEQEKLEEKKKEVEKKQKLHIKYQTRLTQLEGEISRHNQIIQQADGLRNYQNLFVDPSKYGEINKFGTDIIIEIPKGLENRLALLTSGELSPEQVQLLCAGITDEINKYTTFAEGLKQELNPPKVETPKEESTSPSDEKKIDVEDGSGASVEVVWMSAMDIWSIFEQAKVSFDRAFDRTRKMKVGKVGSKLAEPLAGLNFGPLAYTSTISGDLAKQQTQAENEEVSHYEGDYDSNDVPSLIQLLHGASNVFEFKACIQLLAKRGRLDFYHPDFLKQMNRFQSSKVFSTTEESRFKYYTNSSDFHMALQHAFDVIYGDADFFRTINSQNEGSYKSQKEKFTDMFVSGSRMPQGLQGELTAMLKEMISSDKDKMDPQKFEFLVEFALQEGAIAPPEIGLYLFIQGAANGVLPYDRLAKLYSTVLGMHPYLEIFNDAIFNYETMMQWANMMPLTQKTVDIISKGSLPPEFRIWFHTYVLNNPRTFDRLNAIFRNGGTSFDADYIPFFVPYLQDSMAGDMLQINPHGHTLNDWVIQGAAEYYPFALHNIIENYDEMNNENTKHFENMKGDEKMANLIANYVRWDATLEGWFQSINGKGHKEWGSNRTKKPRSQGLDGIFWEEGGPADAGEYAGTTFGYAVHMRNLITGLEPQIFNLLFQYDGQGKMSDTYAKKIVAKIKELYPNYKFPKGEPNSADTMYRSLGEFFKYMILQKQNDGSLGNYRSAIMEKHKKLNNGVSREVELNNLHAGEDRARRRAA